jgi:hypothetical protein
MVAVVILYHLLLRAKKRYSNYTVLSVTASHYLLVLQSGSL